jgi:hypothetical protein
MAGITGARGTGNVSADQRTIDMAERIALLEPDASPLTVLSKRIMRKRALDPKFSWLEDDREPRFDAINNGAGYASGATSLVVDNGTYFAEHDLVQVTRTSEVFRVTGVSTNTLTVIRGVGGGAAAIVDNDELLILGSAQPEGDTSKPARSSNPTKQTNYTQIVRTPWEATGTWRASTNVTTPNDWNHQANKHGIEHAISLEFCLLFGKASEDTSGSQPRRTTGGALSFITTNVTDAGGTFTEAELNEVLRKGFRYGSRRKALLGASLPISVINQFAQGKLETRVGEETYGLSVTKYVTPFGIVDLITHWLLEGSKWGGTMIGLDLDEIAWRYLANDEENRDTHVKRNIQANDADTRKDEYFTEGGMQFGHQKKHFLVHNITG